MKTDSYYCIKDYNGLNINFTKNKTYKAITYLTNNINYIIITDDNNNEIDITVISIIGHDLLSHFITLKKLRQQKLKKLNAAR